MAEEQASVTLDPSSWLSDEDFILVYDKDIGGKVAFFDFSEMESLPPSSGDFTITADSATRLDRLAYAVYGKVALWWVIAIRNGIDDAITGIYPGMRIIIPDASLVRETFNL